MKNSLQAFYRLSLSFCDTTGDGGMIVVVTEDVACNCCCGKPQSSVNCKYLHDSTLLLDFVFQRLLT
jgi:hypothetical protein